VAAAVETFLDFDMAVCLTRKGGASKAGSYVKSCRLDIGRSSLFCRSGRNHDCHPLPLCMYRTWQPACSDGL